MNAETAHRRRSLALLEAESAFGLAELDRRIEAERRVRLGAPRDDAERRAITRAQVDATLGPTPNRRRLSFHEAGHCTVLAVEGGTVRAAWISEDGGQAWGLGKPWPLTAVVAGKVAATMAGFPDSLSATDDGLARQALSFVRSPAAFDAWIANAERTARRILATNWPAVEALAALLLRDGYVAGDAIARTFTAHNLRSA